MSYVYRYRQDSNQTSIRDVPIRVFHHGRSKSAHPTVHLIPEIMYGSVRSPHLIPPPQNSNNAPFPFCAPLPDDPWRSVKSQSTGLCKTPALSRW